MKSKNILRFIYIFRAEDMNRKNRETELTVNPLDRSGFRLSAKRAFVDKTCPYMRDSVFDIIRGLLVQQEDQDTKRDFWRNESKYIILISIWKID